MVTRVVIVVTALMTALLGLAVVAPAASAAPQWWNRGNIPLYSTTIATVCSTAGRSAAATPTRRSRLGRCSP